MYFPKIVQSVDSCVRFSHGKKRARRANNKITLFLKLGRYLSLSIGVGCLTVSPLAHAVTATPIPSPASVTSPPPGASPQPKLKNTVSKRASNWAAREGQYYQRTWGIDIAGVRRVSSGFMLEFRYRVIDPDKAIPLTDKKSRPYLIDEASGAAFSVPAMENVGELRQSAKPEVNRSYYIMFGNPGQMIKPGNRVSVVIGKFRADGIVVQ
ncbi:MAG: hypothetical protein HY080_14825 [Gammaproteobacteria bacterium]|nr:hypothetical protein [Gammaproteobacteria bacterium]